MPEPVPVFGLGRGDIYSRWGSAGAEKWKKESEWAAVGSEYWEDTPSGRRG